MSLPKLNDKPKYKLKIPSTGKQITFRPYLVKEEKILMMAAESNDMKAALDAVLETISACVTEKIDVGKLTTFDVEYIFTQIRAKSAGETAKIGLACEKCETVNSISIKIDEITVDVPKIEKYVEIEKGIAIELKWPSYYDVAKYDFNDQSTQTLIKMAGNCIEAICHDEERTLREDCTEEEITEFVSSMTAEQFSHISEFMMKMPKMEHTAKFTCEKCKEKNEKTLGGLQDFLS